VTTAAVSETAPGGGPQLFAGSGVLLRFVVRRDRVRLAVWVLSLAALTVYGAVVLDVTYPTAADRQGRAAVQANPAAVLLSGPGYGLENYTLGALVANEVALAVMVAAAIMSIQLVVRNTRAEEESGRAELVRAGVVGRRAALTAALLETALANAAVALAMTAGLVGAGLAVVDSLALAAGIAVSGLVFGAVAACTAQLTEHARAASGAALAVLATAVLLRGVGDVMERGGSLLSWLSPIGWAQQTRAFVDLRWWPLLLPVVLIAVLTAVGYRLVGLRDVGAGLLPARPGPAGASALLAGPATLAFRLQRAAVLSWAVALLLMGMVFGSLADEVAAMVGGNARLQEAFAALGASDPTDAFLGATALYLALGVGAFAVGSVLRLRTEEAAGRMELLLATALDRRRYLGAVLGVTAFASFLLLVAAGLGTGLAAAAVRGEPGLVLAQLGAQLVHLPAVLVLGGTAALLVALVPRAAALAWAVVTWTLLLGLFGGLLGLPESVLKTSPFGWTPVIPAEPFQPAPVVVLTLVAGLLGLAAVLAFRRRDVPTT
jgi:ABC-2 type transport system permease protein